MMISSGEKNFPPTRKYSGGLSKYVILNDNIRHKFISFMVVDSVADPDPFYFLLPDPFQ